MSTTKNIKVNEMIESKTVRVIDENGEQKGIMTIAEAINLAQERGLDLVEVSPNANPPVCKILDFGKFRFEQEKKLRESKKKQKQTKIKEIRMQPKIDEHDLAFKVKHIGEFLSEGCKVKVTVRFRGRELAHKELGKEVLDRIVNMLTELGIVESPAKMEGRAMSLMLAPAPKNKKG